MNEVYSQLKVFAYGDHTGRLAGEVPARAPVHVRIKPINACNHQCWYCAYRADDLQLGEGMQLADRIPAAKMDEIVDDLIAMGVKAVTFSGGGEPLLYPGLDRVVERLAQAGIRVATLTNGSLLKGRVADAFARYGTWVRVSMDGWDGRSYAKSRHLKEDAFEGVIGNIADFAARGANCAIGISWIIGRENAAHTFEFCTLAKSIGVEHVKLSACVVANDAATNNEYHDAVRGTIARELEKCRSLDDETFRVVDHYHGASERWNKHYQSCPMLEYLTVIGADCMVYTCQDKAYAKLGELGSIKERSLQEFWFSDENRERISAIDPSKDCLHHCVSHLKNAMLFEYRNLNPEHVFFV